MITPYMHPKKSGDEQPQKGSNEYFLTIYTSLVENYDV
jgi:hypothetical protein